MSLQTPSSNDFESQMASSKSATSPVSAVHVTKRDGSKEVFQRALLEQAVQKHCDDLDAVVVDIIVDRVIRGLYNGVSTAEIDSLLIQNAAMRIGDEPQYSRLAARLLKSSLADEVKKQGILSFSDSVEHGHAAGLLADSCLEFVREHGTTLNAAINDQNSRLFEYFGLRTVYDRYLLKDPKKRTVIETDQYFFLRVACGLAKNIEEAIEFYTLISSFAYMPSTPTLFNSATRRAQMSSCYLLDSPEDSLESIYDRYKDVAMLSKFAGGIGLAFHRVRSHGSLIQGTNGKSNGVIPFLKTLDSSVAAVNQGGKRKGAACIYLETWHADILDFLQLRENTGDDARRTHNLNIANWIPDLFMKRVESDDTWSLFDPKDVPEFPDLYGEAFEKAYLTAEKAGLARRQVKSRELYAAMMKSLAQTGNGWMTFKDSSNAKCNQVDGSKDKVVHLSNLCTEIIEVTKNDETAVCNLGSINLSRYVKNDAIDYRELAKNVETAVKYLDRVIDINFYPIDDAEKSNSKWRPVGLGLMGLQDTFFKLNLAFDSQQAKAISKKVQEAIYFHALSASCRLAEQFGAHSNFAATRAAKGQLQFDLWGVEASDEFDWAGLRAAIQKHGLRNSLLIAIAPTATIASICGSYECIEPQISNLFKRETLSGEFIQINQYLVAKLKELGIWNSDIKKKIKLAEGSIQNISEIPESVRNIYRTAWEIPMRSLIDMAADRGAFIDQSQSLNLFSENPSIGKLSSMYNYSWKKGLKTTYYLRSRAATKIKQTTVSQSQDDIACSLENPEHCEACQ